MANIKPEKEQAELKARVLHAAASLFLQKGYIQSSTREIADKAGVNVSMMNRMFGSKENILGDLVVHVLDGQFRATAKFLEGITEDPILFYAAETALQLHIAESGEHIRELYATAYSMPNTSDIIQRNITGKLEEIFREHLPDLETRDFYELEIASGGIMRNFMARPCDMYFTMERKIRRFLETTFLVYRVPDEKINEAIVFVLQFDFAKMAMDVIRTMLTGLENQTALI